MSVSYTHLDVYKRQPYDNVEVHHIKKEEFDHGKTRDYGASLAKEADILMFMTDDAIPKDKYMVENLIKAFDDPIVTAAYGRQMADPEKNYIEYYTRIFNYPLESRVKTKEDLDTLGIKTFFCSNVCKMCIRDRYCAAGSNKLQKSKDWIRKSFRKKQKRILRKMIKEQ